jgi:hypothetical protein
MTRQEFNRYKAAAVQKTSYGLAYSLTTSDRAGRKSPRSDVSVWSGVIL